MMLIECFGISGGIGLGKDSRRAKWKSDLDLTINVERVSNLSNKN